MFEDPTDDCVNSPCIHGQCADLLNSFKCSCYSGYTGITCNMNQDECSGILNGGCQQICNNVGGNIYCSCNPGFNLGTDQKSCVQDGETLNPNLNCNDKIVSVDGTAESSSTLNDSPVEDAFKNGEWHSNEGNGQWIAYIFSDYTAVCKYCFSSRIDNTENNVLYDTPRIFWAEGSNNGLSWWPLQNKNHAQPPPVFTGASQEVCYTIPIPQPYLRFRLYVPETPGRPTGVKFTVIRNIKLIGEDSSGSCGNQNVADLSNDATVTATSFLNENYPQNAFKGLNFEWHSQDKPPQSLVYDFKIPRKICLISFLPRIDNNEENVPRDCPKSWTFDGSNDGSNWETLKYIQLEAVCQPNVRIQHIIPNSKSFQMYRIQILEVPGRLSGNKFVVIRDVQMHEDLGTVTPVSTLSTNPTISTLSTVTTSTVSTSSTSTPNDCTHNIATNPNAGSASSVLTGSQASFAFEGIDNKKEWHSGKMEKDVPTWLSYTTYNVPVKVCKISFYSRIDNSLGNAQNDCPNDFAIQGSNNNAYWYNISIVKKEEPCPYNEEITYTFKNLNEYTTYRIIIYDVPGRDPATKYVVIRGVKLFANKPFTIGPTANPSTQSTVSTLSTVSTTANPPQCETDTNFAIGGTAFASSFFVGFEAEKGFSGVDTEWQSQNGMPQYLGYHLLEPAVLCRVSFLPRKDNSFGNLPRDCPMTYNIEASNDEFQSETKILRSVTDAPACAEDVITNVIFNNEISYKSYRVKVLDVRGRPDGTKFTVIRDLQMFGIKPCNGNKNLAIDGIATASSEYPGNEAAKAFEGDTNEWSSQEGMPQYINYKLINEEILCKIRFMPRKDNSLGNVPRDCPQNFKIEGSNDGNLYEILKEIEGLPNCAVNQEIEIVLNNDKAYKNYRIKIESVPGRSDGQKYVVLRNIQFYGKTSTEIPSTATPQPQCQGLINYAQGGIASASSVLAPSVGANMAFDGPGKEWHAQEGVPQWIMYELTEIKEVCKITYLPRIDNSAGNVPKDCPKSYKFEGSKDGNTFETLLDIQDQNLCEPNAILTHSFANEKAFKYYRLKVTDVPGRGTQKFVIIRDLRFFGKDDSIACSQTNMAKGGAASASTEIIADTSAIKGFTSPNDNWHSEQGVPQYISYTFPQSRSACSISFLPRPDNSNNNAIPDCPKTFNIYGIDSNNNEKLLKAVLKNNCEFRNRIVVNLNNYDAFKTYKINVIDVHGRTNDQKFVVISDIQIHGAQVCDPNPCNGGTCAKNPASSGYKCSCPNGFQGLNCEINIANFDCNQIPCKNGGTCNNENKCSCKPEFTGIVCELSCRTYACNGHGKCMQNDNNIVCNCDAGYSGDKCQTPSCSPNPCQNSGTCEIEGSTRKCTCINGYAGDTCEFQPGACNPNPCKNEGICTIKDGKAECLCQPGFTGEKCDPVCTNHDCQNGGNCILNPLITRGYFCNCHAGYSGENCEKQIDMPIDCSTKETGDYPDKVCPSNVYYTCEGNKGWLRRCGPQLVYSSSLNQCVWQHELIC